MPSSAKKRLSDTDEYLDRNADGSEADFLCLSRGSGAKHREDTCGDKIIHSFSPIIMEVDGFFPSTF